MEFITLLIETPKLLKNANTRTYVSYKLWITISAIHRLKVCILTFPISAAWCGTTDARSCERTYTLVASIDLGVSPQRCGVCLYNGFTDKLMPQF